jgi:hypothetical protein
MYSLDELAKLYASRYGMAVQEVRAYLRRYANDHHLNNHIDVVEAGRALATMTGWQQQVTDDALYQETEGWAREQGLFNPVMGAAPRKRRSKKEAPDHD